MATGAIVTTVSLQRKRWQWRRRRVRSFSGVVFKLLLCKSNILNINLDPPVVIKDRQHAVLAAHVAMTTRRLMNAQWWGQATVAKAEAEG